MKQFGIGQPVRRVEDRRFITGCGTYLDDIERARQAYAFMLRSPYAHARVRAVDTDVAVAVPGVLGVLTGEDLARDGLGTIPCLSAVTNRDQSSSVIPPHPAMARDSVRHVGDTVAMVVAESLAAARDAAEATVAGATGASSSARTMKSAGTPTPSATSSAEGTPAACTRNPRRPCRAPSARP